MKKRNIISVGLIMAGVAFMAIGVAVGDHQAVLQKAIMICMECIGLG